MRVERDHPRRRWGGCPPHQRRRGSGYARLLAAFLYNTAPLHRRGLQTRIPWFSPTPLLYCGERDSASRREGRAHASITPSPLCPPSWGGPPDSTVATAPSVRGRSKNPIQTPEGAPMCLVEAPDARRRLCGGVDRHTAAPPPPVSSALAGVKRQMLLDQMRRSVDGFPASPCATDSLPLVGGAALKVEGAKRWSKGSSWRKGAAFSRPLPLC